MQSLVKEPEWRYAIMEVRTAAEKAQVSGRLNSLDISGTYLAVSAMDDSAPPTSRVGASSLSSASRLLPSAVPGPERQVKKKSGRTVRY